MLILDASPIRFTPAALFIKAIACNSCHAIAYNNLGLCLETDEECAILANGEVMNAQALFIKAIECDFANAQAYYNLSTTLKDKDDIVPVKSDTDERLFDKLGLLVETIKHDASHASAYYNLAILLYDLKIPRVLLEINKRSKTLTEEQLYAESIRL